MRGIFNLDKFYPFLYGKYDMPKIRKQKIDIENLDFISFNYARTTKDKSKFLQFFLYDYQFERVWTNMIVNGRVVSKFKGAFSPDFSLYTDYPIALQIYNVYRNRYIGAYWQDLGMQVIPTISWSDERSFEFCFEGVEKGSIVAISTVGIMASDSTKALFIKGYTELLKRIEPELIFIYGQTFEGLEGNIRYIKPHFSKLREVK